MDRSASIGNKAATVGGRSTRSIGGVGVRFQDQHMSDHRPLEHDLELGGAGGGDGSSGGGGVSSVRGEFGRRRIVVVGDADESADATGTTAAAAADKRGVRSLRSYHPTLNVVDAGYDRGARLPVILNQSRKRSSSSDGSHERKRFRQISNGGLQYPFHIDNGDADNEDTDAATASAAAGTTNTVVGHVGFSATEVQQISRRLFESTPAEYVETRPGPGGKEIRYIQGFNVVKLANEVFGFNGWSFRIVHFNDMFVEETAGGSRFSAFVTVIVRVELRDGTVREDCGVGYCKNVIDKAEAITRVRKEAVTDGYKRALKAFGSLLGLGMSNQAYNPYRADSRF